MGAHGFGCGEPVRNELLRQTLTSRRLDDGNRPEQRTRAVPLEPGHAHDVGGVASHRVTRWEHRGDPRVRQPSRGEHA